MALVQTEQLSHGTIECNDIAATRRFLNEFLGIDVVRPLAEAQYMWKGGPWSVVCVCVEGEQKDQGPENRFRLAVDSDAEVEKAHKAALAHRDEYAIKKVTDVTSDDGVKAFMLQDLNHVWWEIAHVGLDHYDRLFAAGDKH